MKKFQISGFYKPFSVLLFLAVFENSPKIALAQPDPPHSFLTVTEVLPINGAMFQYAPPATSVTVGFSGKGTVMARGHSYEAFADVFLLKNVAVGNTPSWQLITTGTGDHKTITDLETTVNMSDNGQAALTAGVIKFGSD